MVMYTIQFKLQKLPNAKLSLRNTNNAFNCLFINKFTHQKLISL